MPWIDKAEPALAARHSQLFHYTSFETFEKILESGGMWATHYGRTNDRDEFRALRQPLAEMMYQHVLPLVRERVRRGQLNFGGDENKMEEVTREDSLRSFDILVRTAPTPPHITCFSAHDAAHQQANGLLTMWRLYGKAAGIAIGFNTQRLIEATQRLRDSMVISTIYLDRVGYGLDDPQTKMRLAEAPLLPLIYERAFNMLFDGKTDLTDEQGDDLIKFFVLAISTKNADFEDEREIRLVVAESIEGAEDGRTRLKHPAEGRLLVPYLEAMEEVMIGPAPNQAAMADTARKLLRDAGMDAIAVKVSGTSYRDI